MTCSFSTFRAWWSNWFFRTCPPHVLAIFRIAFGGFLVLYWGLQIPFVAMLYSKQGLLLPLFTPSTFWTLVFTPPPVWVAQLLFWSFLLSLLLFTLGAWTRVSAGVAFLLYVYYWILSLHLFATSFDRLFLFILLVLVFSGCGCTFSFDMFRKRGSICAWEPISILPQRLISLQIAATYLGVGWQKLVLKDWQSGEVIAWGFVGRWATPLAWWVARLNFPMWLFDGMNAIVKAFEITMPFGLWTRFRWWFFLGGALFHTIITLTLRIWWFMVLIPAYIIYFEPEEFYGFLKKKLGSRIR